MVASAIRSIRSRSVRLPDLGGKAPHEGGGGNRVDGRVHAEPQQGEAAARDRGGHGEGADEPAGDDAEDREAEGEPQQAEPVHVRRGRYRCLRRRPAGVGFERLLSVRRGGGTNFWRRISSLAAAIRGGKRTNAA